MPERITFTLDNVQYEIPADPGSFTAAELNAVERNTGMTVTAWGQKLDADEFSSLAWSALAWIAVRRTGKFVPWDAFEVDLSVYDLVLGMKREKDPEVVPDAAAKLVPNRADRRRKVVTADTALT